MKKLISLILALAAVLSLVSCGTSLYPPVESTEEESAPVVEEEAPVVEETPAEESNENMEGGQSNE